MQMQMHSPLCTHIITVSPLDLAVSPAPGTTAATHLQLPCQSVACVRPLPEHPEAPSLWLSGLTTYGLIIPLDTHSTPTFVLRYCTVLNWAIKSAVFRCRPDTRLQVQLLGSKHAPQLLPDARLRDSPVVHGLVEHAAKTHRPFSIPRTGAANNPG